MIFAWLRPTLMTALFTLPTVAWAGGETGAMDTGGGAGTSSGATDSAGTDSGGTDTGGTDTGTTSEGSSSGEICGECTDSADVVQIVSPVSGAVVDKNFEVHATAPHTCFCDTCGCHAQDPPSMTLRIDGVTYEACNGDKCSTADNIFMVTLPPGTYVLDVVAPHDLSPEFSEEVEITVEGEVLTGDTTAGGEAGVTVGVTAGNTTTTGNASSESSGDAPAAGGGGGCGCRSQPSPHGPLGVPSALFVLLALSSARRRRQEP